MEYGSTGPGANAKARVAWAKQLTKKEAQQITLQAVMGDWNP
jgi:pectinesterase